MNARGNISGLDRKRLHRNIIRGRIRSGFFIVLFFFIVLLGRYAYVQLLRHSYYLAEAKNVRRHKEVLLAQRGAILDCNGIPLAINVQVGDIDADPLAIVNPNAFAAKISPFLAGTTPQSIFAKITAAKLRLTKSGKKVRYVELAKSIESDQLNRLAAEFVSEQQLAKKTSSLPLAQRTTVDLIGYHTKLRWIRTYPKSSLACQLVGFIGKQDRVEKGRYGIEKSMDHILSGRDGYAIYEVDAKDHEIPGTETVHVDPVNGGDIQLTIDVTVQRFAEEALAKSVSEHHAQSGECIVMNPKTGDILAMASMPQFDLNHLAGTNNNQWDNHVVSYSYEPGSTLKSVTLSACLNEFGLNYQYTHVYCSGQIAIGGHIIHCAKDPPLYGVHGDEIMRDVLKNSCNIGAAQFAMHLGDEKLYSYEKAFGFLDRPDIGLPGSPPNRLKSPLVKKWSKIQLANIGFGQGISVTPLQLASAYCVFGNEGRRVYPHIIKGRTAPEQSIQVIKPEVAKTMLSMLQTVVEDGTGKPAQIAGYNIGGKTGSAQVVENGHYGGQYIGSFCGIVPLSDPKLVILCAVNKPSGVHWGSVVAAPVVHDVAQQTLWYMQQPRDNPVKLDAVDQAKVDARAKAQAERAKRNRD